MNVDLHSSPKWRTAAVINTVDSSLLEQSQLGTHLNKCQQSTGRWFVVQRSAELMHSFIASRFVTTLAVIAVVCGVGSLLL